MLTLHQEPDRSETYRRLGPVYHDPELDCLCVFDADIISKIFRSECFGAVAYADHYRHITARTGIDFGAIIDVLNHIPLANEGPRHRALRGEMASVIGRRARETAPRMEEFTVQLVKNLFRAGRTIDLMRDLALPIYDHLFSLWLDVAHEQHVTETDFSQVFDRSMSLNRRKVLNGKIERLRAVFEGLAGTLASSPDIAVAMNIIGNDAFVGSIALSVWHTLSGNAGRRIDEIEFPTSFPSTGVPYIERMALETTELSGFIFEKGRRIRLFLDATTVETRGVDGDVSFGKGRHLCLGKPISLVVWLGIAKAASACDTRFSLGELRFRPRDYVFNYPEVASVRFHD